jgi:DNA-binding NarL/FixJ family response regulator
MTSGQSRHVPKAPVKQGSDIVAFSTLREGKPGTAGETGPEPKGLVRIAVIEPRALIRDCLVLGLSSVASNEGIAGFASFGEWMAKRASYPDVSLVLLCASGNGLVQDVAMLGAADPQVAVALLAETEETPEIYAALDKGARGYIPLSLPLEVAVEAIRLIRAGGVFVPASSFMAARAHRAATPPGVPALDLGIFTARQAAVVEALRQGKANKTIAHELQMRESTVKVHVRNIMKKLNAKNRTEVAFQVTKMTRGSGPLDQT